jgi:hypothetical protein
MTPTYLRCIERVEELAPKRVRYCEKWKIIVCTHIRETTRITVPNHLFSSTNCMNTDWEIMITIDHNTIQTYLVEETNG